MKRIVYLCLLIFVPMVINAVTVTIAPWEGGNGPQDYPCPYGNYYRNSRNQYIFTAQEIQEAGGGAGPINSMTLWVQNMNEAGPIPNFRINIGATPNTGYYSYAFITNLTTVWSAPSHQPVVGANVYEFNPAFIWDGTSNICVDIGNTLNSYFDPKTANPTVSAHSLGYNCSAYFISDAMNAYEQTNAYALSALRINVGFDMGAVNPVEPNTASVVAPLNGSTNIPLTTQLSWANGGGYPTGYRLYFGTDNPPPLVADLGDTTSWTPPAPLAYSSTYHWQIVPYNALGDAQNCPVWHFTTCADPTITAFPWTQGFGTSINDPAPPAGWGRFSGQLADSTSLTPASGGWVNRWWRNATPSSGNRSASCTISYSIYAWLITPPIAVPDSNYQLVFDAAYVANWTQNPPTSGGWDDKFIVLIGDGTQWTPAQIARQWDNNGSPYVLDNISHLGETFVIPMGSPGVKYVAFYAASTFSNTSNQIMIDYVTVRRNPDLPQLTFYPSTLDFGLMLQNHSSAWQSVTITNSGQDTLHVEAGDIGIFGADSLMFGLDMSGLPFDLTNNQSAELPVIFTPTDEGQRLAILRITNNQNRAQFDIPLSGNGYPSGTITVGEGTEEVEGIPIEPNDGYSYSQCILLQSEIATSGRQIEAIRYYRDCLYEADRSNDWTLYMGHTDKAQFADETDWVPASEMLKVFEGEVPLPGVPGWVEIRLDTPFVYNNTDNLVIAVDENEALYLGMHSIFRGWDAGANRGLAHSSSGVNAVPASPPEGVLKTMIPNVILLTAAATTEPRVFFDQEHLDFRDRILGQSGPLKLVKVTNAGTGTLLFNSNNLVLSGSDASQFTVIGDGMAQLENGQQASFIVQFNPTSTGAKSATITYETPQDTLSIVLEGYCFPENSFYMNFEATFPYGGWYTSDSTWIQTMTCSHIQDVVIAGQASLVAERNRFLPETRLISPLLHKPAGAHFLHFQVKGFNNCYWYGASNLKVMARPVESYTWVQVGDSLNFYYNEDLRTVSIDLTDLPNNLYHFAFCVSSSLEYWDQGNNNFYSYVIFDDIYFSFSYPTPLIELDQSNLHFAHADTTHATVNVFATDPWTATSSVPWLHFNPEEGLIHDTLSVSVDPNPGLSHRDGTITLLGELGVTAQISVRQYGKRGNALAFDGIDDMVTCGDNDDTISQAFSIVTWVKWNPSSPDHIQFLCAKGYEQLEIHTGAGANDLRFIPTAGVFLDADCVLPVDTWTHVACTYNWTTGSAHMYIDGVEVPLVNNGYNPTTTPYTQTGATLPFVIGRRGDNSYLFSGSLDEMSVWSRELTQTEIQALMITSPVPGVETGLVNYFDFNQGIPGGDNSGITALPDLNGVSSGTLTGFALSGDTSNWVESGAMVVESLQTPSLRISPDRILTWDAIPGADSYKVYRATSPNGSYTLIATTSGLSWQETDMTLGRGYYRVTAATGFGTRTRRSAETRTIGH